MTEQRGEEENKKREKKSWITEWKRMIYNNHSVKHFVFDVDTIQHRLDLIKYVDELRRWLCFKKQPLIYQPHNTAAVIFV